MANYSITISNTFNVFGGGRCNRYGSAITGATAIYQSAGAATYKSYFGVQPDLELNVIKYLGNTITLSDAVYKKAYKQISNDINFTNTFTTINHMNGDWYYLFADSEKNAIDRTITSWTSETQNTTTWTSVTVTTTSWTEV